MDVSEEPTRGDDWEFKGSILDRSIIARPLMEKIAEAKPGTDERYDLIVDLNFLHVAGMSVARELVYIELIGYDRWSALDRSEETARYLESPGMSERSEFDIRTSPQIVEAALEDVVDLEKARYTPQYVYPKLTASEIQDLVTVDGKCLTRTIYKIWPDFKVDTMLTKSTITVKANAARNAFRAAGKGIVWAVADTGIDGSHAHFARHRNLDLSEHRPLEHIDFTGDRTRRGDEPKDLNGHGTHVAGIIAGESRITEDPDNPGVFNPERWAGNVELDQRGEPEYSRSQLKEPIAGIAPMTKLVSVCVLDEDGTGKVSSLLAAIGYVQEMNDFGRQLRIHGMNMSVGYGFDPEWFACGQSPLCVEVDRLVRSGVSVVVAAGNTGYAKRGRVDSPKNGGVDITINDPGNAEEAITVGATHSEKPHMYGVSYFSSKGPTGDGRLKPDLVAPGEKVLSCAAGAKKEKLEDQVGIPEGGEGVDYRQESGTSMAAPHVSGAIAAFLSVRTEFIGKPQRVKEIFMSSATDLGRERYFQGSGLVDVMRALQSI